MSNLVTVLVTGAGSLVGQGILRSLQQVKFHNLRIITADPERHSSGHWLADIATTIPLANNPEYVDKIKSLVAEYDVKYMFIGADPELDVICKHQKEFKAMGVIPIVSSAEVIAISDSKWETVQFLKQNGFDFPDSALSSDEDMLRKLVINHNFPLFAKPVLGARSVGAGLVNNKEELQEIVDSNEDYIIQELLQGPEYTSGILTIDQQVLSIVTFKRTLKDGNTFKAFTASNEDIDNQLAVIASNLVGLFGSANFQFKLRDNKPVIFEINGRFSGTTPLRAMVGVNELQILLDALEGVKLNSIIRPTMKGTILRTFSDIFISDEELQKFEINKTLIDPKSTYFPFKK